MHRKSHNLFGPNISLQKKYSDFSRNGTSAKFLHPGDRDNIEDQFEQDSVTSKKIKSSQLLGERVGVPICQIVYVVAWSGAT